MRSTKLFVGTAGWAVSAAAEAFPEEGTALQRYAAVFDAVEINSSFHRRHRPDTWRKWAESTPARFRFAAKLPKTITHKAKLVDTSVLIGEFADDVAGLGDKLAVVLIQLPPSLAFDAGVVMRFFADLSGRVAAQLACEPRHPSWFEKEADALLVAAGIARVAADPALVPAATRPGGSLDLAYWRLHGSPRIYRSAYGEARLGDYAAEIEATAAATVWCMFDNTASSAAIGDALMLSRLLA